jgi:hypothetical protein
MFVSAPNKECVIIVILARGNTMLFSDERGGDIRLAGIPPRDYKDGDKNNGSLPGTD